MRYMMMVKGDPAANEMPTTEMLAAMGAYNEELVKAGVLLDGDGLKSSAHGKRVTFGADGSKTVTDGPFAETKELLAGFWILELDSMDEAMEWAQRVPFDGTDAEIEVRPFVQPEDFGDALTPELQAEEARIRELAEANQRG